MNTRSCKNCGAPIPMNKNTCEYCGTVYENCADHVARFYADDELVAIFSAGALDKDDARQICEMR